jgi:hypothetical protein
MNAVTSTWRQLVRRRLWPVAVLLLAALVAVPVLLAREPAVPEPLAPVPVTTEADDTIAEPVLAQVTPEDRERRRRVLGVRKDPFMPAPQPKAKKADTSEADKAAEPSQSSPGTSGGTGTGGEPAPEKTYYSPGTIIVRFGEATSGSMTRFAVEKLGPVPNDEVPLLVYMGLTKDGKRAKFLVDETLRVDGDGRCRPHKSSCEIIELAVGETEFIDVLDPETGEVAEDEDSETPGEETETEVEVEAELEPTVVAQFQLDLVDIKRAGDADVR